MRKRLTTKSIEALPPAKAKRYEVRDELMRGLLLRVSATGGKVWYVNARDDGRVRRIKLGAYPVLRLAEAREMGRTVLRDVQIGRFTRDDDKTSTPTFGELVDQFIELYARPRNRDWRGTQRTLTKFGSLNAIPIDGIRRADVVRVIDDIVAAGSPVRANRALAAVKRMLNWCVDRGVIETSPVAGLKAPSKEIPRDRVLDDDELARLWLAADDEGFPFGPFTHMLVLTGQRRGEVAGMRRSELDLDTATWTLPAGRVKNAKLHVVPLPPLAIDILKTVPRFLNSDLVFTTNGRSPISGFGRLKDRLDGAVGASDWRLHDIRRTVATGMAKAGVQPHIVEAVLNHRSGIVSGVAAVYNRHAYLGEKREALTQWAGIITKGVERNGRSKRTDRDTAAAGVGA